MIICFNKIAGVCIFVVIGLAIAVFGWGTDKKILLSEIQVLTLHAGRHTSFRRAPPLLQLKCLGGSAGCIDAPEVVQCRNMGWDGHDVHWECKAELPVHTEFGRLTVNCEGYDYAGDFEVLVGSCGLEYYLEVSKGKTDEWEDDWEDDLMERRKTYDWEPRKPPKPRKPQNKPADDDDSTSGGWLWTLIAFFIIVLLLAGLYYFFIVPKEQEHCGGCPSQQEEEEAPSKQEEGDSCTGSSTGSNGDCKKKKAKPKRTGRKDKKPRGKRRKAESE